jgi:hypothetical protein
MRSFAHLALLAFSGLSLQCIGAESPVLQTGPQASQLYSLAAREAQYRALASFVSTRVGYDNKGRVSRLEGSTRIFIAPDAHLRKSEVGAWVSSRLKPVLLASSKDDLEIRQVIKDAHGEHLIFMDQRIAGLPVIDGGVNIKTDASGEIRELHSRFVPASAATKTPSLSLREATDRINALFGKLGAARLDEVHLSNDEFLGFWTDEGAAAQPHLVWLIHANVSAQGERMDVRFAVDAATGDIRQVRRTSFGLNRTVYSLGYRTDSNIGGYPQNLLLLWTEGNPSPSDAQGMFAYQSVLGPIGAWALNGLYQLSYDWPNIVVHHGSTTMSQWGGNRAEPYMIFGDKYAQDHDAIAHEYGHGVFYPFAPGYPSSFVFYDEWFAANEFWGDLSVVFTDFHRAGSTDWQVTDVRNLANPAAQGDDLRDWYPNRKFVGLGTPASYANSTIFSHAVYLMIHGGWHARAGLPADNFSGTIPYIYVNPLPATTVKFVFADALSRMAFDYAKVNGPNLKEATVASASRLYGASVAEEIDKAWRAVGIGFNCSGPPAMLANITYIDFQCRGKHRVQWTQVPGIKYHGEAMPLAGGATWENSGYTTTDGAMSSCMQNVGMASMFRLRACNACGCSDWAPQHRLNYYSGICR